MGRESFQVISGAQMEVLDYGLDCGRGSPLLTELEGLTWFLVENFGGSSLGTSTSRSRGKCEGGYWRGCQSKGEKVCPHSPGRQLALAAALAGRDPAQPRLDPL